MPSLDGQRILVVTHLGIQRSGNQSLRNAVYHYALAGARVTLVTSLPPDYPGLLTPEEAFGSLAEQIEILRFPQVFQGPFYAVRALKNRLKRGQASVAISREATVDLPERYRNLAPQAYDADMSLAGEGLRLVSWVAFFLVGLPYAALVFRRRPFDLVVGQEIYGACVASALGRLFQVPVVNRFQGSLLWPELEGRTTWRYPHHVLGSRCPADLYVMTNDGTRGDEVLRRLGVKPDRIRFWLNGFSLPPQPASLRKEAREDIGLPKEARVVLTVNKLKFWKRLDRAVHTLSVLRHAYGWETVHLVIVGDGPERPYLERLADKAGVADRIRFLGAVDHARIQELYSVADIFLLVNDLSNLSNPLMEAMYAGCPIVTLNDGSTNGLLRHGENAWLVDLPFLTEGLPQAVNHLLQNSAVRAALGQAAAATARRSLPSWPQRMSWEIEDLARLLVH